MSLSDSAELNVLSLLFKNTTWAGIGDATGIVGSTVAGSLYLTTFTANPGETGTQLTNESAYTGYTRGAVVRSAAGWTTSGTSPTQVANAATVSMGADTAGTETETHFSVGKASSGAGENLWFGALNASLIVNPGVTPTWQIGAAVCTIDLIHAVCG